MLGEGVLITLTVTGLSVFFGVVIGLFMSLAKLSRHRGLKLMATIYIDFIRGTPLLVQILLIYFGIPGLVSAITGQRFGVDAIVAGVVACSINSGAYVAEIFRAGIQSIDKGQNEASRSLGMNNFQTMLYVVLPQAFRRVIPPLGNEIIVLLKDSSLLSVIGVQELLLQGKLYAARTFAYFPTYLAIALVYLVLTLTVSRLTAHLERKLGIDDQSN